jgi:methionine-rich copper-binding protein CopC
MHLRSVFLSVTLTAATAVVALAPASASAASAACRTLPATVSLSSSDPTVLRDDPAAVVRVTGGAKVDDLRVTVTRNGRTYASGTLTGRLASTRTAVTLRLPAGRTIRAGKYRVVATGKRSGCSRRTAVARTWSFGTPSLPVRAAPVSTLVSDNSGGVRLLLRAVDRQTVSGVTVSLVDAAGATVAQTTYPAAFTGQVSIELPLAQALPAGSYTLRVSGTSAGTKSTTEQKLAFAAGSSAAADTAAAPTSGEVDQRAVVDWSGGSSSGRDVAGFVAPGIGYGEITCNPNAQWIRFYPNDLGREVSMMNWTYRDWGENQEKAIREALHTAFTGNDFREGLNKFSPAEKTSTGEFDGIISDRGGLTVAAPTDLAAPTTLKLTWKWDFSQAGNESCHVEAELVTQNLASDAVPLARSTSIAWRGADAAPGHDTASVAVPGLGTLTLTCAANVNGSRTLTVDSAQGATITTREGSVDTASPQAIGPVTANLPNNGQVAITFPSGATLLASSRWKVNDPDPAQNSCFVAAQAIVPS